MAPKKPVKKASSSSTQDSTPKLKPATAINVRHILCEKHAQFLLAKARLAGTVPVSDPTPAGPGPSTNFADIARDLSTDKARQGGSLGWKVRGSLDGEFEKVAYALPVSTPARPVVGEVKSRHGWHLIMVEGRR